jgi:F-type H+-transporting ATPase subunit b
MASGHHGTARAPKEDRRRLTLPTEQLATWSWPKRKRVSNCAKRKLRQLKSSSKPRSALTQIVEEAREQARVEADRVKAQALAEIEQELNSVKDALRAQVGAWLLAVPRRSLAPQSIKTRMRSWLTNWPLKFKRGRSWQN